MLSPKVKFEWTGELSRAFALAKEDIIRKIHEGIKMFEVGQKTALVTDWSKTGQALGLWQKHCQCGGPVTIACCRGGWRIVFM